MCDNSIFIKKKKLKIKILHPKQNVEKKKRKKKKLKSISVLFEQPHTLHRLFVREKDMIICTTQ